MLRVLLKALLLVVCITLVAPSPALAIVNVNAPLRTVILPQADAPVRITNCAALANDFVSNYSNPPQYLYTQVHTEVSFVNVGTTDISAVRFAFEVDDSFNHAYTTLAGTAQGTYAPGVQIEPHRRGLLNVLQNDATAWNGNVSGQDIGAVGCYVQDVRFSDGRVWTADITREIQAAKSAASTPYHTESQVLNPMPTPQPTGSL